MTKPATEVMQEVVFASVLDAVAALKGASKGMPNALLRDINAIGPNAVLADLPKELQAAIAESVRTAFNRLLKEGYAIAPAASVQSTRPPRPQAPQGQRPGGPRSGPRPSRGPAGPRGGRRA